jgi:choline dehydrogenase-like flavoprotein
MELSAKALATFDIVVDTILPATDGEGQVWTTPGRDLGFSAALPSVFERLAHDLDRRDLARFLGLLDSAPGGSILFGKLKAFTAMTAPERADAYLKMEGHPLGMVRGGVKALKTLIAFMWVTTEDPKMRPGAWDAMGYPGPVGPPLDVPKSLQTTGVTGDAALTCDVVVVGSGAGGGTAAGVLAAAGLDVIVLEAGDYRNESDFDHLEATAYRDMYLNGALKSTSDGGTTVLSGATLGGGTVVNYTTSFSTPEDVCREWDEIAGFSDVFTGEGYAASANAVKKRLSVNQNHGWPSMRDQLMEKGLRELGWHAAEMPRNVDGCRVDECGYCTMGCRLGAKRSTTLTYIQDAADHGARIVTGAHVEVVLSQDNGATGVQARVGDHQLTVNARAVVLAAGALNTPAILLRSGLGGGPVGKHLHLHPVTAVWARFEERIEPWAGILQSRYSDEFVDLDGRGYGFRFETAPVHPLFPASFLGWEDGPSFKRDILNLGHLDVAGILLRDRDHGEVVIRKDGSPVWKYAISEYDKSHIREGVLRAAELYAAAGAAEIISSTIRPVRWQPGSGRPVSEFMDGVDAIGYGSNRTGYFTFHQMGSARMGSDPATSVVDDSNQVHGVNGLYVMDGSCFPTASGVNPMLSIASIAHRGATLLAQQIA